MYIRVNVVVRRARVRDNVRVGSRIMARGRIKDRRLADGNVHCAGSATYQICFRLPIPNPNPNPKINEKTKRHRNKIQHRVISKS